MFSTIIDMQALVCIALCLSSVAPPSTRCALSPAQLLRPWLDAHPEPTAVGSACSAGPWARGAGRVHAFSRVPKGVRSIRGVFASSSFGVPRARVAAIFMISPPLQARGHLSWTLTYCDPLRIKYLLHGRNDCVSPAISVTSS